MNQSHYLRDLAQRYRDAATSLEEAADILDNTVEEPTVVVKRRKVYNGHKTRIEEIKDLIREHGPLTLKEVIGFGIPRGTASTQMTEKTGFVKVGEDRWGLPEEPLKD